MAEANRMEEPTSLFGQQTQDKDKPEEPKPDYTYVIALAVTLPVAFYFRHIGKFDLGLNISLCLGMCIVAVRIRWDLRSRVWFWAVIAFVLGLHIPLFFIQWPHRWVPGHALLPIGLADIFIFLGAVWLVEKLMESNTSADLGG